MQSPELRELIREHAEELDVKTEPVFFEELIGPYESATSVLRRPVPRDYRWLSYALAAAAVVLVLIGGAALLFAGSDSIEPVDTPIRPATTLSVDPIAEDIQALISTYTATWNNSDSDAFLALVTDDFRMNQGDGWWDATTQAADIERLWIFDWDTELIGEPMIAGTGPWYVAVQTRITTNVNNADGLSVFTIVDDDGALKVSEHLWIGD